MPRHHGFRIYVVQAFPNRQRVDNALDCSAGSAVAAEIETILDRLHARGTIFIAPAAVEPGEPERSAVSITVGESTLLQAGYLQVVVATGSTGSHRTATREAKKPRNLDKWSPEADHYVTFVFPKQTDDRFLVVSHAIARFDPLRRLLAQMEKESRAMREAAKEAEDAERERLKAEGLKVPKRLEHRRLVFDERQATDSQYLDSILTNAKSASATFVSKVPSNRGSNQLVVKRRLTINLHQDEVQDVAKDVTRGWAGSRRRGVPKTVTEGVSEVAALMVNRDLLDEDEAARYDSVSLRVTDQNNDSTTVAVDSLRDAFTYSVSDGRPDLQFYFGKVAPRLSAIALEEELEVDDIDPREVADWLNAST